MNKKSTLFFLFAILGGFKAYTQTEITLESSDGYLNDQIMNDTNSDGSHDETTYILKRDETYYVRGAFENYDFKLHMVAEDGSGAMPIIRPAPDIDGDIEMFLISLYNDFEAENIMFNGVEYGTESVTSAWLIASRYEGIIFKLNNCILINAGLGAVVTLKDANSVIITNSKFYNEGNIAYYDIGTGRMIDLRNTEVQKLIIEHNTIVNTVDRVLRHRDGNGVLIDVEFNHNTIVNNGSYYGMIEFGRTGNSIEMSNNLIIDGMSFGSDPADTQRQSEFNDSGETDDSGNPKITWVRSDPNDSTVFSMKNNVYCVTDSLQAFYTLEGVDEGDILTDTITARLTSAGFNIDSAFIKKTVTLVKIPAAMTELGRWYYSEDGANKNTIITSEEDYDRMSIEYMLDSLDCSYTVTDDLYGTDGLVVGDLNWFGENDYAILTKYGEGPSSQTINLGDSIVDFYYEWQNAASVVVSGLPDGITTIVDNTEKTISFSGTPADTGTYDYTLLTVGAEANTSVTGTITVIDTITIDSNIISDDTDVSGTNIIDESVVVDEPHIYPNPITNNELTIVFSYVDKNTKIELFNIIGTLIYCNDNITELETIIKSNVSEGNYVLKITNQNSIFTKRVIVK